jgi:hypothetical protein
MKVTKQTKFEFTKAEIETLLVGRLNLRQKTSPEINYEYTNVDGKYSMEKVVITIVDSSGPEEKEK